MGIKVTLRQKPISKGRKSLYLDFYPAIPHPETGKPTRREFLGLYIFAKASNPLDKQHNKEQLMLGEQIRQKRENFLNKPEVYSEYEKEQLRKKELGERDFVAYFKELALKRRHSNHDNWMSALKYLETFTGGSLKFADLNEKILEEFKEYLLTTKSNKSEKSRLATNSAVSYFNKVKAALKQAYADGILLTNLNAKVKPIKPAETHREWLTLEELNTLVQTPCNDQLLKRVALFSALTGMRFSDLKKLEWSEVQHVEGEGYFIKFKQQKTKGAEVLPISDQAAGFMGKRQESNQKVFPGLKYSAYHSKYLFQWIGAAGITKDITFHCFRHTFAVLQLFNDTDIYTVSKMLGHRDIKTTQIYAKIVDETKRQAANKIQLEGLDFDNVK